jgi:hypothetical protein
MGPSAAVVVGLGFATDLRQVMHGALLALGGVALVPFALIALGVLLYLLAVLLILLIGAAGGEVSPEGVGLDELGGRLIAGGGLLIGPYYRFLARSRHPLVWGTLAGVLLGGLLLWALIAIVIVPREARTAELLAMAKQRVDRIYQTTGAFPGTEPAEQLSVEGSPLLDAFGRPLRYRVSGKGHLASYTLGSLGFDGKPSGDDLCVAGSGKLAVWADRAARLGQLVDTIASGSAPVADRLSGIRSLRCEKN